MYVMDCTSLCEISMVFDCPIDPYCTENIKLMIVNRDNYSLVQITYYYKAF